MSLRPLRLLQACAIAAFLGLQFLPSVPTGPAGSDKLGHVALWSATALITLWDRPVAPRHLGLVALGAAAAGSIVEATQGLLPGRNPELADILADVAGAVLGALAVAMRTARKRPETSAPQDR